MNPLVSVIIVNRNGIDFVDACLKSVLNSSYPDFEVIFVDNASTDGSLRYVKDNFAGYSNLKIIENKESLGPAVGRNYGAAVAKGEYLFFLDNDTRIEKNCIGELAKVFESDNTIGSAQAKLLQTDDPKSYDCAGDYLGPLGFLVDRAKRGKDTGQFDRIEDIFNAKSAASIIRKNIFDEIKGFDADFYMYLEETDLSWRVWLSGHRVVFIPKAIVYHAFGKQKQQAKSKGYYPKKVVRYYGCRNYITMLVKNFGLKNLIKILPVHILSWSILAFLFFLRGKLQDCWYIIKGIGWNAVNITILINKRSFIQRNIRRVSDNFIMQKVAVQEKISDYLIKSCTYLGT